LIWVVLTDIHRQLEEIRRVRGASGVHGSGSGQLEAELTVGDGRQYCLGVMELDLRRKADLLVCLDCGVRHNPVIGHVPTCHGEIVEYRMYDLASALIAFHQ
jgi:hypothetical protein